MARTQTRLPVILNPDGRHQCQHCGVRFDSTRPTPGRPPSYCSAECDKARLSVEVPCAACGEMVSKRSDGSKSRRSVCSTTCRAYLTWGRWPSSPWVDPFAARAKQRRAQAERRARIAAAGTRGRTWYVGTCRECGTSFTTDQPFNVTCSRKCAAVASRQRRRARKVDAFVAPVYRAAIFERDKWTCQLCGKKLKRNAVVPHPLAPTIDHIVPLGSADRGTHEPANCQAAHFLCNSRKGAGGGEEQLALIG